MVFSRPSILDIADVMRLQFSSTFGNGHGLSAEIIGSSPSSVILVANKIDQVEDRMVSTEEGNDESKLHNQLIYILFL